MLMTEITMKSFRKRFARRFDTKTIIIVLCGIICISRVPSDAAAGHSNYPAPLSSYATNDDGALNNDDAETVASGTNLYCYECSETYDSSFDPYEAPCLHNLSQITIRKCSYADKYCSVQTERYVSFQAVLSISRGCVTTCPYGCYFHNYGAATQVCLSCCRSYGCNTGSGAIGNQRARTTTSWQLCQMTLMLVIATAVLF